MTTVYSILDSIIFFPIYCVLKLCNYVWNHTLWIRHPRTGHKMFPNIFTMFINAFFKSYKMLAFILIYCVTFYCDACNGNSNIPGRKTFSSISNLNKHIRRVHEKVKHHCLHSGCSRTLLHLSCLHHVFYRTTY